MIMLSMVACPLGEVVGCGWLWRPQGRVQSCKVRKCSGGASEGAGPDLALLVSTPSIACSMCTIAARAAACLAAACLATVLVATHVAAETSRERGTSVGTSVSHRRLQAAVQARAAARTRANTCVARVQQELRVNHSFSLVHTSKTGGASVIASLVPLLTARHFYPLRQTGSEHSLPWDQRHRPDAYVTAHGDCATATLLVMSMSPLTATRHSRRLCTCTTMVHMVHVHPSVRGHQLGTSNGRA